MAHDPARFKEVSTLGRVEKWCDVCRRHLPPYVREVVVKVIPLVARPAVPKCQDEEKPGDHAIKSVCKDCGATLWSFDPARVRRYGKVCLIRRRNASQQRTQKRIHDKKRMGEKKAVAA